MSFRLKAVFGCIFLLAVNLVVYFSTLAPAVGFIDSGELAVVCQGLGIAHPTGYPLYTLLGRLFCLLPLGDTIFRVNLMSLAFTCCANVILFFILLAVVQSFRRRKHESSGLEVPAALTGALIFSFTPTLWSQAVSNEVYSLNVLLYSLIILLVLMWRNRGEKPAAERILYLLIFAYALSFGNHMSTVLLAPAILFILLITQGKSLFVPRRMVPILTLFLLGLSVYIFLPIRSAQNPVMDWGNPETWSTFKRHVSGWQYQVWMFAQSGEELGTNLWNFIKLFLHQFPPYLLPLSLLGVWRLATTNRKILGFLLILFLSNIAYGISYGIPDIDPYFLGSFLTNAIFIGVGLHFVFRLISDLRFNKGISHSIMALFMLIPLVLLARNFHQADRSKDFLAYDFASNLMRSVKKDAVILTNVWDHYSPWLYLRFLEHRRPDVDYLDTELCRRTWYFDYVEKNYAGLFDRSEGEIKRFLKEVQPFESRRPFDANVIESAYINMFESFLVKNFKDRPLYDDLISGPRIGRNYLRIPEGMVFSVKDSLKYYPYDFPDFELRGVMDRSVYKDDRTLFNLKRYPLMIDLRLRYLSEFEQDELADRLFRRYKGVLSEPFQ